MENNPTTDQEEVGPYQLEDGNIELETAQIEKNEVIQQEEP